MKRLWARSLVLGLGLWGGVAAAGEFSWQPTAPRADPVAAERPTGATLGRPVPLAQQPAAQAGSVTPVAYWAPGAEAGAPVFRGQKPDSDPVTPPADPKAKAKKDKAAKATADRPRGNPPPGMPALLPAPEAAAKPRTRAARPQPAKRLVATASPARPATRQVSLTATEGAALASPVPVPVGGQLPPPPGGPLPAGGEVPCDGGLCDGLSGCVDPFCCDGESCTCEACPTPLNRFYGSVEYLLWATKDGHAPVLATTGPVSSLGFRPGARVLFGGDSALDYEEQSGGRVTAGYWLDPCQENGIEASAFFLGQRSVRFQATTDQFPLLARPFFNASTGMETAQITAMPGVATGKITIDSPTRLWGAEADWRHNLCCGCAYRLDLLAGFRFVELDEGLHITENAMVVPGIQQTFPTFPFPAGTEIVVQDRFDTHNQFYGAQVGLDGEVRRGRWSLEARAKVALGSNHEVVNISGDQLILPPGRAPQAFQGGLLALSSNSGHHVRDRFAVVPEVGVTVGYQLTDKVRIFAGYNFLFISNVVRPGDQIDTVLDARRIPNFVRFNPAEAKRPLVVPPRPMFQFHETSYWAQGLTTGLEFKY